jgi:hypothetical protein
MQRSLTPSSRAKRLVSVCAGLLVLAATTLLRTNASRSLPSSERTKPHSGRAPRALEFSWRQNLLHTIWILLPFAAAAMKSKIHPVPAFPYLFAYFVLVGFYRNKLLRWASWCDSEEEKSGNSFAAIASWAVGLTSIFLALALLIDPVTDWLFKYGVFWPAGVGLYIAYAFRLDAETSDRDWTLRWTPRINWLRQQALAILGVLLSVSALAYAIHVQATSTRIALEAVERGRFVAAYNNLMTGASRGYRLPDPRLEGELVQEFCSVSDYRVHPEAGPGGARLTASESVFLLHSVGARIDGPIEDVWWFTCRYFRGLFAIDAEAARALFLLAALKEEVPAGPPEYRIGSSIYAGEDELFPIPRFLSCALLIESGFWGAAEMCLEPLRTAQALNYRGLIALHEYHTEGKADSIDAALTYFRRAARMQPHPEPLLNLSIAHLMIDEKSEAVDAYHAAEKCDRVGYWRTPIIKKRLVMEGLMAYEEPAALCAEALRRHPYSVESVRCMQEQRREDPLISLRVVERMVD